MGQARRLAKADIDPKHIQLGQASTVDNDPGGQVARFNKRFAGLGVK